MSHSPPDPDRILASAASDPTAPAGSDGPLSTITGWAVQLMEHLGAPGAGAAVALENLFPPIPSEVILPLAGFAAAQGRIGLVEAIVWTTIGSVVGAFALYLLGRTLGHDRLRALMTRLPLVDPDDLDKGEAWFARFGGAAVFFGRLVPIVRSLISVPAGVQRMPQGRFLLLTAAGSSIWNTVLILIGHALGARWHEIEGALGTYQRVVVGVAVVLLVAYVVRAVRRRRRRAAERPPVVHGRGDN